MILVACSTAAEVAQRVPLNRDQHRRRLITARGGDTPLGMGECGTGRSGRLRNQRASFIAIGEPPMAVTLISTPPPRLAGLNLPDCCFPFPGMASDQLLHTFGALYVGSVFTFMYVTSPTLGVLSAYTPQSLWLCDTSGEHSANLFHQLSYLTNRFICISTFTHETEYGRKSWCVQPRLTPACTRVNHVPIGLLYMVAHTYHRPSPQN